MMTCCCDEGVTLDGTYWIFNFRVFLLTLTMVDMYLFMATFE